MNSEPTCHSELSEESAFSIPLAKKQILRRFAPQNDRAGWLSREHSEASALVTDNKHKQILRFA